MWPFKGEDSEEPESSTLMSKVPITTLYRWYMYDMNIENPNEHLNVFNITPISDEGDEKEREESDARTDRIEALIPFMNLYANMNAHYIFEMQKADLLEIPGITEEKLKSEMPNLKQFYRQISFAAILTMLSSAIELGLLIPDGSITDIDEVEYE